MENFPRLNRRSSSSGLNSLNDIRNSLKAKAEEGGSRPGSSCLNGSVSRFDEDQEMQSSHSS